MSVRRDGNAPRFLAVNDVSARVGAGATAFINEILPRLTAADGFVGGYWLNPVDGEGCGFILFETAEQARRATPPQSTWSAPGVAILALPPAQDRVRGLLM